MPIINVKCENCHFKSNGIVIFESKLKGNAGYRVIQHLSKHSTHIIELGNGRWFKRYCYNVHTALLEQIEDETL